MLLCRIFRFNLVFTQTVIRFVDRGEVIRWLLAMECAGRYDQAVANGREAVARAGIGTMAVRLFHSAEASERIHEDQPRIGENATLRDELVLLGQDPFMEFPASNLAA